MEPRRHLFLDLEDTIINPVLDGWFNTRLVNVQKIRDVIADFRPHEVHIFSFAIWNENELLRFNEGTRPMIERALGVKLGLVPTVDGDILPACCVEMGINVDRVSFSDAVDFWSKHQAFRLFMRKMWKSLHKHNKHVEVCLVDDAVFNETFEWKDLNVKGELIDVRTL